MEMVVGGLKRALAGFSPVHERVASIGGEITNASVCVLYICEGGRGRGRLDQAGGGREVLVLWGCPSTSTVASKENNSTEKKKKALSTSGACCPARHYLGLIQRMSYCRLSVARSSRCTFTVRDAIVA